MKKFTVISDYGIDPCVRPLIKNVIYGITCLYSVYDKFEEK